MKLIVRDYLKSLKEDGELDRVLVDLLSQMGLAIQGTPQKGVVQHGVDLWATGTIEPDEADSIYLFSVKRGDLTRDNWDNGKQSLRSSIDEIVDAFIHSSIFESFSDKHIVVSYAIGGEVESNVLAQVKGFLDNLQKRHPEITFRGWNGDMIATQICKYLLNDKLLCGDDQSLLFQSLAMVAEPDAALRPFKRLINNRFKDTPSTFVEWTRVARSAVLCLGLLDSHCQRANNLEASFVGSEYLQVSLWEYAERAKDIKGYSVKTVNEILISATQLMRISQGRFLQKIAPLTERPYHLSHAVVGGHPLDINLRLFDLLGRASSFGLTSVSLSTGKNVSSEDQTDSTVQALSQFVRSMVINNPTLLYPICDDFCIETSLAAMFMAHTRNYRTIHWWLAHLVDNMHGFLNDETPLLCVFKDYRKLVSFYNDSSAFQDSALPSSEFIPTVALISLLYNFGDIYRQLCQLVVEHLPKTNFQLWFPDQESRTGFFHDNTTHGNELVSLPICNPKRFLTIIAKEIETSPLDTCSPSTVPWVIFSACRLHRIPLPVHFWSPLLNRIDLDALPEAFSEFVSLPYKDKPKETIQSSLSNS